MLKMQNTSNYAIAIANHIIAHDSEMLSFKKEDLIVIVE